MDALSHCKGDFLESSATNAHQHPVSNPNFCLYFGIDSRPCALLSDKTNMSPRNISSAFSNRQQGLWSSFESYHNPTLNPVLQLSSTVFAQPYAVLLGKDKNNNSDTLTNSEATSFCKACGVYSTPEWRKGPDGKKSLCNACGLRYSRITRRIRQKREEEKKVWKLVRSSNTLTANLNDPFNCEKEIEKGGEREGAKEKNGLKQVCAIEKKPEDQAKEDQKKIILNVLLGIRIVGDL